MTNGTRPNDFKVNPVQRYAVLTGDIVDSSKLDSERRRRLPDAIKEASAAARSLFKPAIPLEADVFRGDSWQFVVADFPLCLRVALFLRAHLRGHSVDGGLDSRIGIGIGSISFLPKERVSQGDGVAFRQSGETLESMRKNQKLALAVEERATPAGVAAVVALIDSLMSRWTGRQALAVVGALRGQTQAEIGESWSPLVKQQVIARHLQQANWEVIEKEGLTYVENTLKEL